MREINSIVGLSSTRKRIKQFTNLAETMTNSKLIEESTRQAEFEEYNAEKINNLSNARTLKEKSRCKNVKNKKLAESMKMDILSECFANLVLESLLLDEDYIEEHNERFKTKFKETFTSLVEHNMLAERFSPLFEDYITPAIMAFDTVDSSIEEPKKIVACVKGIETEMKDTDSTCCEAMNLISETVKDKVLEVIKEEKVFASKREYLKETYRKHYDGTSLFNSINMLNLKEAKDEYLKKEDIKDVSSLNEEQIEELNNIALAETIADYTLLEVINTCDLFNQDKVITAEKLKKQVMHLYKL